MISEEVMALLGQNFLGNSIWQYALSLTIFLLALVFIKIFKIIIISRLKHLSKKTKTDLDDTLIEAVDLLGLPFYTSLAAFFAVQSLTVPPAVLKGLWYLVVIISTYYAVKVLNKIIDYGLDKIPNGNDKSATSLMKKIAKGTVAGLAIVMILQNLGYEISALVAGFGISGIAVAFALQNILADVFASFSIYFDKPFKIGDFIVLGNDSGVVKKIGIKSTRIRALQGHEIVISNKELTESRVHNYKKMKRRRVAFSIGVEYGTPVSKLKKIPKMVEDSIKKQEETTFDRAYFKEFGDSALLFDVVYFVESGEHLKYRNIHQEINLDIAKKFEKAKISMAFPSTTVYLRK